MRGRCCFVVLGGMLLLPFFVAYSSALPASSLFISPSRGSGKGAHQQVLHRALDLKVPRSQELSRILSHQTRDQGRSILDQILDILHFLGYTDEEMIQFVEDFGDEVVDSLSELPPKDVFLVEMAAGRILGMLQSGELDGAQLQADLQVIYDLLWPLIDESFKGPIELLIDIILWILG